jgi:hypothetical protein
MVEGIQTKERFESMIFFYPPILIPLEKVFCPFFIILETLRNPKSEMGCLFILPNQEIDFIN